MGQGLTFMVAGPMKGQLEALRKKHNAWLKELKKAGKAPPQALDAYVAKSVPNLSSLVLLTKIAEKTMPFTGDARGDKILQGLELVGLLKKGGKQGDELAPLHSMTSSARASTVAGRSSFEATPDGARGGGTSSASSDGSQPGASAPPFRAG